MSNVTMPDRMDFPSNVGFKQAPVVTNSATKERPVVEKIVKGNVSIKKPSLKKRFQSAFIGSDKGTVSAYIVQDILIPGIKNALTDVMYSIFDGIGSGFEMLLFGDRARGSSRRRMGTRPAATSSYNYNGITTGVRTMMNSPLKAQQVLQAAGHSVYDKCILDFEKRSDAEEILYNLADLVQDYGSASVADMLAFAGQPSDYTDQKYGWRDTEGSLITRCRDGGFTLELPRPILLD